MMHIHCRKIDTKIKLEKGQGIFDLFIFFLDMKYCDSVINLLA